MIDIVASQEISEVIKTVDMNKTLLIMGKAETNHAVNQIMYYDTTETVRSLYGDSDLTDAFVLAKQLGVPHVFLINVQHVYDYIEIANVLRHYDFAYIASTDLFLSDGFYDANKGNRWTFYYHHFLERMSPYSNSIIVATDKHALLYEDIDAYLDEMTGIVASFKNRMDGTMDGKNICFVANHLSDYPFANIVLASIFCVSELDEYPSATGVGETIFDFDDYDIKEHEIVYFKNNHLTGTTIENLINFDRYVNPQKIITVDRIAKYVKRNLDLSRFKGKQMTPYQKLRIEKALVDYFDSMLNWILRAYEIKSIRFIKDTPGSGIIYCDIDIWTINSIEKFSIAVEG